MRLLLDGFWLPSGPPSGRAVLSGLLQAWLNTFPEDELHVSVKDSTATALPGLNLHRASWPLHPLNNLLGLGKLAREIGADAVLAQNFLARAQVPSYTFVHDVLFLSNPEWFSWKERLYLSSIPFGMRRATGIFTSSETEKRRILDLVRGVSAVRAVGLSPAPALAEAVPVPPEGWPGGRFLVCVGRLNERKNLLRVIDGFLLARKTTSSAVRLLVVGPSDGLSARDFKESSEAVHFLGAVSDDELRWVYENAVGLIFGSLDEGFGLPPVEALSFGCPVAVSDIPVMREVAGPAAIYFDPVDVSNIAEAIMALVEVPRSVPRRVTTWNEVVERIRRAIIEQA